jgi:hypothetical protein
MISQDVHVRRVKAANTMRYRCSARGIGVSERNELTPCMCICIYLISDRKPPSSQLLLRRSNP